MERIERLVVTYKCSICGHEYEKISEAQSCESQPVTMDRGVKVGDNILCINGQGAGEVCRVEAVHIIDKYWAHYAWQRYWHTIVLDVKFPIGGNRWLTYDDYSVL